MTQDFVDRAWIAAHPKADARRPDATLVEAAGIEQPQRFRALAAVTTCSSPMEPNEPQRDRADAGVSVDRAWIAGRSPLSCSERAAGGGR